MILTKRLGNTILIILILLQTGGLLNFYQGQQLVQQKQMQQLLNSSDKDLVHLSMSAAEFELNRINSHEVLVNGKMYDIKLVTTSGNRVEITALEDTDEVEIKGRISNIVGSGETKTTIPRALIELLALNYVLPQNDFSIHCRHYHMPVFVPLSVPVLAGSSSIFVPPPQLV